MDNFQGGLLNPWICFFGDKKADHVDKHPKAVQISFKNEEFLIRISPKITSNMKIFVAFKTASQKMLPCLKIPEFIVFLLKLNCSFPPPKKNLPFLLLPPLQ